MKKLIFYCFLFVLSAVWSQENVTTYTYAVKGRDELKMDVYTPDTVDKDAVLPVLLWMHGGGFSGGLRNHPHEVRLAKLAAEKGYLGVSISYRLTRRGKPEGFGCDCSKIEKLSTFKYAVNDYMDAAKFIYDNRHILGADPNKIIAGGSSAGAEAVLNAVFMREHFVDDLKKYKKIKFAGLFSLAGAVLNADYVSMENAVPSVFFHGTDDDLVPFGNASHHRCKPDKKGYLLLDGSAVIVDKLAALEIPYYFYKVNGGKHELASIPFDQLDEVFEFFDQTVFKNEVVQTIKIINRF